MILKGFSMRINNEGEIILSKKESVDICCFLSMITPSQECKCKSEDMRTEIEELLKESRVSE